MNEMNEQPILFETLGTQLGLITLNRPQALNALTLSMTLQIHQQLLAWARDPAIQAVLIQAVPGRAFCAGGDIRSLYRAGKQGDFETSREFFRAEYRLNHLIHHYPKPYIALLNGITMGGGVGISIYGSHRVATEHFSFAMPEVGIGFFPDIGASYFLSRCPQHVGYYLALTGNQINCEDARWATLIDHTLSSHTLPQLIHELAETPLNSSTATTTITRILQSYHQPVAAGKLTQHAKEIAATFLPDSVEQIVQRLAHQDSPWSKATLQTLLTRSPLSLKVALKSLQAGTTLSLDDCLRMEYQLACNFLLDNADFYEGIRAAVIDKDRQPRWQSASLADVDASTVNRYFQHHQPILEFAVATH